jgi:hypothetical protein
VVQAKLISVQFVVYDRLTNCCYLGTMIAPVTIMFLFYQFVHVNMKWRRLQKNLSNGVSWRDCGGVTRPNVAVTPQDVESMSHKRGR